MGTATVQLKDTSINFQFRPYSETHRHRFNKNPDKEEHPGGTMAIAFDKVSFSTGSISFNLEGRVDQAPVKDYFDTILRIFFGDLQGENGWSET